MSVPRKDVLDGVLIEQDEDGFHLILSGEMQEYIFRLPGTIAEELLRATKREIEPWVLEGQRVREERRWPGEDRYQEEARYEL